ncbi:hypothetical protein H2203_000904 [Taxawa tesnikishii (nom. ined.)]|nr:hypothetical protein H2203_000904 [Dothideales sp. JES 119]
MTRAQQTISIALLVTALYQACYFGFVPLPATIQDEIIPVVRLFHLARSRYQARDTILFEPQLTNHTSAPLWAIVSFGAYLLFKLGLGVFTFNDIPEAHKELMGQIEQARADLRTKGVSVD